MSYLEIWEGRGYIPLAKALAESLAAKNPNHPVRSLPPRSNDRSTENGACLALIYEQLGGLDDMTSSELRDTDGDGVSEVCDAWGTPLRLYRWPTGHARVRQAFAKSTSDPEDPENLLADTIWRRSVVIYEFERIFHKLEQTPRYPTWILVSAGPDRKFGLRSPNPSRVPLFPDPVEIDAPADEEDNLYSFNLAVANQGR
jgi:hypothetical protein